MNAKINSANIDFIQGFIGAKSEPSMPFTTESSGNIKLRQYSVVELMRLKNFPALNLLHCDTQGAETAIIASCMDLMKNRQVEFAVFSTHAHQISGDPLTHQRCLQMLQDFGGTILAEHDVHESYSGDGLIAAYFGDRTIDWHEPKISRNRYSTSLFRNPIYDLALSNVSHPVAAANL